MWNRLIFIVALLAIAISGSATAQIKIADVGQAKIETGAFQAHELSGIAYTGQHTGNTHRFLAVSDSQKSVYSLDIEIDPSTGAVESAKIVAVLELAQGTDLEAIALPDDNSMYITDEVGPAIRRYSRADGSVLESLTLPDILAHQVLNKSLESLAFREKDKSIWTANEEALKVDGKIASVGNGTTVRIFKLTSDGTPAGQWAYNVEPIESAFLTKEVCGVSELAALPNGQLLVMERALDGKGFRSQIYLTNLANATDISDQSSLIGVTYTPAEKSLLWEKRFGLGNFNNYEGMCLGPKLKDGTRSLLLISDDNKNGLLGQTLYALKISGIDADSRSLAGRIAAIFSGAMGAGGVGVVLWKLL